MGLIKRFAIVFMLINLVIHNDVQTVWINFNSEFVKQLIIVDKKIKEELDYLMIDVEIPQISGLKEESLEKVINNDISNAADMWIKDVKDIAQEYFGPPINERPKFEYQVMGRYKVKRNTDICSMYIDYYQYTGGAHGITNRVTYNIDTNSGKELTLKNLFKDNFNFTAIINQEIYRKIAINPENYFHDSDGFNGIKEEQEYFLDDRNLFIQFQHYEIAPYSSGMPTFEIPLNLFEENFLYGKI